MSPTSRSSRLASASTIASERSCASGSSTSPSRERGDVAADRGQRRAQLVRDRHQEVPLARLRLHQPLRHLPEAVGEMADLARGAARHRDVVVAAGDLVGGVARAPAAAGRDAARRRPRRRRRRGAPTASAIASRRTSESTSCVDLASSASRSTIAPIGRWPTRHGLGDRVVGAGLAGRREVERQRLARGPVDRLQVELRQPGLLAREEADRPVEVEQVAGRLLELVGGEVGRPA